MQIRPADTDRVRILRTDVLIPGLYFVIVAPLALFVFFAEGTHMTPTLLLPFATPWWIVMPTVPAGDDIHAAWRVESLGYLAGCLINFSLLIFLGVYLDRRFRS
jgi:hypothetical protein